MKKKPNRRKRIVKEAPETIDQYRGLAFRMPYNEPGITEREVVTVKKGQSVASRLAKKLTPEIKRMITAGTVNGVRYEMGNQVFEVFQDRDSGTLKYRQIEDCREVENVRSVTPTRRTRMAKAERRADATARRTAKLCQRIAELSNDPRPRRVFAFTSKPSRVWTFDISCQVLNKSNKQ